MIPIVGDLMKHLIGSRMQFMNPVETPLRFVQNVRNSIGLRPSQRVDAIFELFRASSKLSSIRAVALLAVIKYFN
jgi:hypothetical protein